MDPDEGLRRWRVAQRELLGEDVRIRTQMHNTASSRRVVGLVQQQNAVHKGMRLDNVQVVSRFYNVPPPHALHVGSYAKPVHEANTLDFMTHKSAFNMDQLYKGFDTPYAALGAADIQLHEGLAKSYKERTLPQIAPFTGSVAVPTMPTPSPEEVKLMEAERGRETMEGMQPEEQGETTEEALAREARHAENIRDVAHQQGLAKLAEGAADGKIDQANLPESVLPPGPAPEGTEWRYNKETKAWVAEPLPPVPPEPEQPPQAPPKPKVSAGSNLHWKFNKERNVWETEPNPVPPIEPSATFNPATHKYDFNPRIYKFVSVLKKTKPLATVEYPKEAPGPGLAWGYNKKSRIYVPVPGEYTVIPEQEEAPPPPDDKLPPEPADPGPGFVNYYSITQKKWMVIPTTNPRVDLFPNLKIDTTNWDNTYGNEQMENMAREKIKQSLLEKNETFLLPMYTKIFNVTFKPFVDARANRDKPPQNPPPPNPPPPNPPPPNPSPQNPPPPQDPNLGLAAPAVPGDGGGRKLPLGYLANEGGQLKQVFLYDDGDVKTSRDSTEIYNQPTKGNPEPFKSSKMWSLFVASPKGVQATLKTTVGTTQMPTQKSTAQTLVLERNKRDTPFTIEKFNNMERVLLARKGAPNMGGVLGAVAATPPKKKPQGPEGPQGSGKPQKRPRFEKGSVEAKEYMAMLRAKRKKQN